MESKRLEELEALAAAAKPGPWEWEAADGSLLALGTQGSVFDEGHVLSCPRCKACQRREEALCLWPREGDAAFIAAARTAVPELCAAVRQARQDALREALAAVEGIPCYISCESTGLRALTPEEMKGRVRVELERLMKGGEG